MGKSLAVTTYVLLTNKIKEILFKMLHSQQIITYTQHIITYKGLGNLEKVWCTGFGPVHIQNNTGNICQDLLLIYLPPVHIAVEKNVLFGFSTFDRNACSHFYLIYLTLFLTKSYIHKSKVVNKLPRSFEPNVNI